MGDATAADEALRAIVRVQAHVRGRLARDEYRDEILTAVVVAAASRDVARVSGRVATIGPSAPPSAPPFSTSQSTYAAGIKSEKRCMLSSGALLEGEMQHVPGGSQATMVSSPEATLERTTRAAHANTIRRTTSTQSTQLRDIVPSPPPRLSPPRPLSPRPSPAPPAPAPAPLAPAPPAPPPERAKFKSPAPPALKLKPSCLLGDLDESPSMLARNALSASMRNDLGGPADHDLKTSRWRRLGTSLLYTSTLAHHWQTHNVSVQHNHALHLKLSLCPLPFAGLLGKSTGGVARPAGLLPREGIMTEVVSVYVVAQPSPGSKQSWYSHLVHSSNCCVSLSGMLRLVVSLYPTETTSTFATGGQQSFLRAPLVRSCRSWRGGCTY